MAGGAEGGLIRTSFVSRNSSRISQVIIDVHVLVQFGTNIFANVKLTAWG